MEREQQRYIECTGEDLVLDNPDEPTDDGLGIGLPIPMQAEPPEAEPATVDRAVRRRVGSTREESRWTLLERSRSRWLRTRPLKQGLTLKSLRTQRRHFS